jgi:hypothetical protein
MEVYQDPRVQEEHRKDLLREAEQYHLVKQALEGRPHRTSIQSRLFYWLNQRLNSWVCLMQKFFGRLMGRTTGLPDLQPCREEVQ